MSRWSKSKSMVNKKDELYKKCFTAGIKALSFKDNKSMLRGFSRARSNYNMLLEEGEKHEVAISIALFNAASWDWDEYIMAIKAVNRTFKKRDASAPKVR
jgi:hypothetical protein